jgi:hypothetical protein
MMTCISHISTPKPKKGKERNEFKDWIFWLGEGELLALIWFWWKKLFFGQ